MMLHKYRKKVHIKAEQFDGSDERMKKYDITADFPGGDTYTLRIDNTCLPLKRGWWILDLGSHQVLGVIIHDWRTMSDDKFQTIYERVD